MSTLRWIAFWVGLPLRAFFALLILGVGLLILPQDFDDAKETAAALVLGKRMGP